MPAALRDRIKREYEAIQQLPVGVNPVKKVPLLIYQAGESLLIDKVETEVDLDDEEPAAGGHPRQRQQRMLQQGSAQGLADHTTAQLHAIRLRLC